MERREDGRVQGGKEGRVGRGEFRKGKGIREEEKGSVEGRRGESREGERRVKRGKEGRVEGGAEKGQGREGNRQLQPFPPPPLYLNPAGQQGDPVSTAIGFYSPTAESGQSDNKLKVLLATEWIMILLVPSDIFLFISQINGGISDSLLYK